MWTLEEGLVVARCVERHIECHGAHAALAGGVMSRGWSDKDLDILIYPHDSAKGYNVYAIQVALKAYFNDWFLCKGTERYPRDGKEVWTATTTDGKRVDFFFLMSEKQNTNET